MKEFIKWGYIFLKYHGYKIGNGKVRIFSSSLLKKKALVGVTNISVK